MKPTEEIIVVLGLDADQKPRAAKFKKSDEKAARKIAQTQQFKIGVPKTDEGMEKALSLVEGRTFSSGKGLIPLVSPVLYENLVKLLTLEDCPIPAAPAAPAKSANSQRPNSDPWSEIRVGTVVLYHDGEKKLADRGWWECTVLAVAKDTLDLKWTHHPTLKRFKIKRALVALLPPKG